MIEEGYALLNNPDYHAKARKGGLVLKGIFVPQKLCFCGDPVFAPSSFPG